MSDPNTEHEAGANTINLAVPPVIPPQVRPEDDVLFQGDQVMVTPGVVAVCGRCYAVRNIVSASLVERRSGPNYGLKVILWLVALTIGPMGLGLCLVEPGFGLVVLGAGVGVAVWAWTAPVSGTRFSWEFRLEMNDRQEVVQSIGNQLEAQAALEAVLTAMSHK